MKKFISTLLAFILILLFSSCSKLNISSMKLSEADLTEQEQNIVNLLSLNNNAKIFNFSVDETIKSVSVNSYELNENGEWESYRGVGRFALNGTNGRIALSFNQILSDLTIAIQVENGTKSTRHNIPETIDSDGMSTVSSFFTGSTEISYEKEIPIAIQIITSKDEVSSYDVEYFSHPEEYKKFGYEHVYAVTVTFSQKELD